MYWEVVDGLSVGSSIAVIFLVNADLGIKIGGVGYNLTLNLQPTEADTAKTLFYEAM